MGVAASEGGPVGAGSVGMITSGTEIERGSEAVKGEVSAASDGRVAGAAVVCAAAAGRAASPNAPERLAHPANPAAASSSAAIASGTV